MKKVTVVSLLSVALCVAAHAEIWQLSLAGAVKGVKSDQPLTLNLATQDGKAVRAIVQGFNGALHDVDATGLKSEGRALKGAVKVTLHPDNWIPADKKPIACEYNLEATAAEDGAVTGKQTGKFGTTEVAGTVTGKMTADAAFQSAKVQVRFENALNSQKPALRSALITFAWAGDKAAGGQIAWVKPDKFHWTGKIEGLDVKLTTAGLTGQITANIATGSLGEVEPGKYVFTLEGQVVGSIVAGKFKAKVGDKNLTGGTFAGTVK